MGDNFTISITILLTGFVVVFAVLFMLIAIVKIYGTIVYNLQNKSQSQKQAKQQNDNTTNAVVLSGAAAAAIPQASNDAISEEIIAVIAAAVDSIYGSASQHRIKSIKKADSNGRSSWGMAGIMDNTRPF